MEQNTIQWLGPPCCLRGAFAFYKAVCYKPEPGASAKVWRLGEFYYVRCGSQEPVSIAEVTLLWEDQRQRHLLASSRLYFPPEDTPKGRTGEHGEDEVLAVSKKVVLRVEDLVNWTCTESPQWKHSCLNSSILNVPDTSPCATDSQGLKTEDGFMGVQQRVKVLSYPQYCRFRSLQRRLQDQSGSPGLHNPHLLALGGLKMTLHNTRVLYCRDTFNHPNLGNNLSLMSHFGCPSLSLKGRPRKRKGRESSGSDQQHLSKSEPWGERMKENVMGGTEESWEGSWLPHPEEQLFLDQLYVFMERRGSPISKVPNLGFKKIDLFLMYSIVKKLGGYESVTSQRLWKTVYNELGGSPGSTSAATCTRRHYEKLMLPYEQHVKGADQEQSRAKATVASAVSIRRPARGRGAQTTLKKNGVTNQATPPDGVVVRKRGRPPGKRNAKALARGRVGRPPLHAKTCGEQGASDESQALPIFQEPRLSQAPASTTPLPHQPKVDKEVKTELEPSAPSLSGQSKLQIGTSLEGFSPTNGMCPLDFVRARLGFNSVGIPHVMSQDPLAPNQPAPLSQTKACSPETSENLQHQCSGCSLEDPSWTGGPKEGRTTRPPLPPLKILPLDIDCSLQLRQLMRTRLGTAHMNSFTKRLSEALSQDLSKTYEPNGHSISTSPEQAVPLNLSKKNTSKRSSDEAEIGDLQCQEFEGSKAKTAKMEPEDLRLPQKQNGVSLGVPVVQEEPADLSSPCRVRALPQDRTSLASTCPEAGDLSSKLEPDASSDSVFPTSVVPSTLSALKQKESELIPVDAKLGETHVWKSEPERALVPQSPEPCLKDELVSQRMPYKDSKMQNYKVPSLKELSSSHLSKPSQSC
ncbi:AT-rich interactive domain-containing protein 5B [Electrophorus electricus]|uniref:AT-rich interactive domain-containing protein 5B n=1 Tax=Electrophorus electricus TaxID=8005 RepID=UPI0015D0A015|nr:AT-rich interactive domain-containing protein 5B [Electrophorus electricus]